MRVSGGIRFLPLYGLSGSGKTSAALELATHLPQCDVFTLSGDQLESRAALEAVLDERLLRTTPPEMLVAVVDQYEEAGSRPDLPKRFVETLSLIDRTEKRHATLVIWLTTTREFQTDLANATSRNTRILLSRDFELVGPPEEEWPNIIEETFEFHNHERPLADFGVLPEDVRSTALVSDSLGASIEKIGGELSEEVAALHDLSRYRVVMLWPVTDALRITRVQSFTNAREGYRLNWNAWFQQLNEEDRQQLQLDALNRARLYFDVRLVPIAAADLEPLCRDLGTLNYDFGQSYLNRFRLSHFHSVATDRWNPSSYAPLREREDSQRGQSAKQWYPTATSNPTGIGRRIAEALTALDVPAAHEKTLTSEHGRVRADVLVSEPGKKEVIVELKAFAPDQTRPSSIKDAIRTTLRRHAQFAGFLPRS
ncbi:MAG: hypothetical protein JWQ07_5021 [Ramlibacter sp.]|jgi:hypothetical protein|nr:hypothetical protein [Ramlibacter sp.]